jgi:uncharacterized coiled-coil protein SlyX
MQDNNKYMQLEKRITKLEDFIGNWKELPEFVNITQTVEYLYQMIQYLNPNLAEEKLRGMEKMLSELKMSVDKKRDPKLLRFEYGEIENLYEMSKFALSCYKSLPCIVEKMNGLKYLHEQNASLVNRVVYIEKTQDDIEYMMKQSKELLEDVKEGLDKNMATLENNLKSLDSRLAKVTK